MDGAAFPFIDMEGCGNHFFSMPVSSVVFCMGDMSGRSVMGCCPSVGDG